LFAHNSQKKGHQRKKEKKKRAYAKMERDADKMKNYLVTNVVPDGWNTAAK